MCRCRVYSSLRCPQVARKQMNADSRTGAKTSAGSGAVMLAQYLCRVHSRISLSDHNLTHYTRRFWFEGLLKLPCPWCSGVFTCHHLRCGEPEPTLTQAWVPAEHNGVLFTGWVEKWKHFQFARRCSAYKTEHLLRPMHLYASMNWSLNHLWYTWVKLSYFPHWL